MWRLTVMGIGLEIEYFLLIFSSGLVESDGHGWWLRGWGVTEDEYKYLFRTCLYLPTPHLYKSRSVSHRHHPSHPSPLGCTWPSLVAKMTLKPSDRNTMGPPANCPAAAYKRSFLGAIRNSALFLH